MKWTAFNSEIPSGGNRLVPKRPALAIPTWVMGVIAIVLVLAICAVTYVLMSGSGQASPSATVVATRPAQTPTIAPAILAPGATTATTPIRLSTPTPAGAAQPQPQPQVATHCDGRTAETRYVATSGGVNVYDTEKDDWKVLGKLAYQASVQVFGTLEGRTTGNSNKWFIVRYNTRCAFVWADPKESNLSLTRPR